MSDETQPGGGAAEEQPPGAPRWVKITIAVAAVLVLAALVVALAGGEHGPGRHFGGNATLVARV